MRDMRRIFFLLIFFAITPAFAAESETQNSFTVTSVEKCYAALSPEDALDIQRNYIKPYQECRRRLELKEKEKKKLSVNDETDKDITPPARYYQVQRTTPAIKLPTEEKTASEELPPHVEEKVPLR